MKLKELFKKKEEKKIEEFPQQEDSLVGTRFFIQYSNLSIPIYTDGEHPYYDCLPWPVNVHYLETRKSIGELYTIVEIMEDDKLLDLVTGEIYSLQILDKKVLDTVTPEYEDVAMLQQERMLKTPLALSKYYYDNMGRIYTVCNPKEVVLKETLPRKDEIIAELQIMKKEAISCIRDYYNSLNQAKIDILCSRKEKSEEQIDKFLLEQEKAAEEELKRKKKKKHRANIDEEFSSIFSSSAR